MRVVVADDVMLTREGIAHLLVEAGIDVVAQAEDADGVLREVRLKQPEVAIVDIRMPPTHTDEGLVAAAAIRARHPEVGVLVLSQYVDAEYALRLVDGDATGCGYLLKDRVTDARELIAALDRVADGEVVIDSELVDGLLSRRREANPLADLTDREREVLRLMAEGLTDRGIAERLWVTPKTVETHVRHILRKLDIPSGTAHNRRVHAVLAQLRS